MLALYLVPFGGHVRPDKIGEPLVGFALGLPQARQIHGGPQCEGFRTLGIGGVERFAEIHFRPGDVGVS